ncbi:MAG: hypothetical protein ACI4RD_11040 [Kiritimatiellia bacterium]
MGRFPQTGKSCRLIANLLAACLTLSAVAPAGAAPLAERWFHLARNPLSPEDTAFCLDQIATAASHGYTAMLWAVNMDDYPSRPAWWKQNFLRIRQACRDRNLDIVPMIWSVGYGTMLGRNPNLAEGFPVTDMPYLVGEDRTARFVADAAAEFVQNGSFEDLRPNGTLAGWNMLDRPGVKTFVDDKVFHSGRHAVRMERFTEFSPDGSCRITQKLALRPWTQYECSMWVKTEDFTATGAFNISFYDADGCLAGQPAIHRRPTTLPWTRITVPVQTKSHGEVTIYAGTYRGAGGKLWMDDFSIRPTGLPDVLRRPGCPFVVKHAQTLQVYDEGVDYEPVEGLVRGKPRARSGTSLELRLTKDSRIRPGDRLLVSGYRSTAVKGGGQVCVCMSEPELYRHFETCAGELKELIGPTRWVLSMDEVRMGGTCAACVARHTDMAHILGDCVTKQFGIIRRTCPEAKVYVWADMFDRKMNAVPKYMLCEGSFVDSWRYIPKELVILCWDGRRMAEQLAHFSGLGFRTFCASYYDAENLDGCRLHLKAAKATPGCEGIMYTTFVPRYELLGEFGDMAAEKTR